ncbi:MAG: Rpn family recombination-promoting nuclease/putative transposase, partial [Myxococcales bacterium]|nr:Rpn family recombination-promoting nuclease/putative transposase [Myxococcales bacterium]
MPGSPHDRLFKFTFGQPEHAASVLRTVLPAALLERLDLRTLEPAPGSFVDAALSERHADLLFRVQIDGHSARVYLLFDHQSGIDRQMPLRLLRYMTRIWTAEADAGAEKLPPIIPCLLYHGDTPWSGPRFLHDQLDLGADLPPETVAGLVPDFRFLLVDLSGHTDADLQSGTLTAMAAVALLLFKHARHADDLTDRLVRWSGVLRQVMAAPNGLRALEAFARYILQVSEGVTAPDLGRVLLAEL